jgi:hypothetical protein
MRKKIIDLTLSPVLHALSLIGAMLFARCIPDSVSKGHGAAQRWRNP